MAKLIIFDIGGVIIDFTNDKHYYPYLARVSGRSVRAVKRIIEGPMWAALDKDQLLQKDFDRRAARRLGIEQKELRWYEIYERYGRLDRGTLSIVRRLHRNYKLAYLSNVDKSRYTWTLKLLKPYFGLFDYRFASCEIHLRKPTRLIYNYALRRARARASDALFIDNQIENVVGARRADIRSILFKNHTQLARDLRRFGVL